jgi:alpha-beta hydrolase superfamily lysophospholipase
MQHIEGHFSGAEGVELYYQGWLPAAPPRARVIICHGVADHGGRYQHVVARLVEAGYTVYAHDHRGHVRSGGVPLHVERFQLYVDDLATFCDLVSARETDTPLYLLAHSMGSAIALRYVLDHAGAVDGLISSGTALYAGDGFPPWVLKLNQGLATFLPRLRLTAIPTQGVSRDITWVAATRRDPYIYHGAGTTRLGAEILRALEGLRPRLREITLPLLILQGENDILTGGKGAQLLYAQAASQDKTLKVYAGAYHEVFNDLPEAREAFLDDLVAWLDTHSAR